jgi:hypothetical protein
MKIKEMSREKLILEYGVHYFFEFSSTFDKGICYYIEERLGRKTCSNTKVYSSLFHVYNALKDFITTNTEVLSNYHYLEIEKQGKVNLLTPLIHKGKLDKISHHKAQLKLLEQFQSFDESDMVVNSLKPFYKIQETNAFENMNVYILDLRDNKNIQIDYTMIKETLPIIEQDDFITVKYKVMSFNLDQEEISNLYFIDNYYKVTDNYHIFSDRETAYNFSIDALININFNGDLKEKHKVARKLDNLFG